MKLVAVLLALSLAVGASCYDPDVRRQALLERAAASEAAGDLDGVVRTLEGALSRDPRDVTVRRALADHWLRRGRGDRARRVLEALPPDVRRDADYTLALARISLDQDPVPAAALALPFLQRSGQLDAETLDRFLSRWILNGADPEILEPLSAATRLRAVDMLIEEGQLTRATGAWRALVASEPGAGERLDALLNAAQRGSSWRVLEDLEPELRQRPTPRASLVLHELLIRRGDWAEAEAVENEFLESRPNHPERYPLLLSRARRECRSGSAEECLELAREATRLRPDLADGFVEQAVALRALGRDEEARQAVDSALLAEPLHRTALRLEAQLEPPKPTRSEHSLSIELR